MSTKDRILELINLPGGIIEKMTELMDAGGPGEYACPRGTYFAQIYSVGNGEMITPIASNQIQMLFRYETPQCVLESSQGWTCLRELKGTPPDNYNMCPAVHAAEALGTPDRYDLELIFVEGGVVLKPGTRYDYVYADIPDPYPCSSCLKHLVGQGVGRYAVVVDNATDIRLGDVHADLESLIVRNATRR